MNRLLLFLLLSCVVNSVSAQQSDRDRAIQKYDSGMALQALPLLAKAAAADSADREVFKRYAMALLADSKTLPDSAARRRERVLARAAMVRAQILGANDSFTAMFIAAIPPNGGRDITYSSNPLVEEPMQRGEKAFASRDMTGAIAGYREAFAIDPSEYNAALYLGDAYAQSQKLDSAFAWYRRAIAINPNRETAYRYMGDVMLKDRRFDEARDQMIEAGIAEPFNRLARGGFAAWARASNASAGIPLVDLSPRGPGSHARATAAYDSVRKAWAGTPGTKSVLFAQHYPSDSVYRHSLAEEMDALQAAAALGEKSISTDNIKRMADAGVLEAYVFFVHATEGDHWDYPAYAKDHHDALKRFWVEFVVGAKYVK